VPGAYEVVLVAPPTRSATVDVTAELMPVQLATRGSDGVRVTNLQTHLVSGSASMQPVGAGRRFRMRGGSHVAARERLSVPTWAGHLQVDVAFPADLWPRVTDVGATLWDADGYLIHENPLNYPTSRYVVTLAAGTVSEMDLELMPAFALPDEERAWEAEVRVSFLPDRPLVAPTTVPFELGPRGDLLLGWTRDSLAWLPAGLEVLTEVTASTAGAPPAVMRAMVAPMTETR